MNLDALIKKAFTPAPQQGGSAPMPSQAPASTPPPPPEANIPASPVTPPPSGGESSPQSGGGEDTDLIQLIEKVSDTVDQQSNRIDALENQLMTSNAKVTELYGNINMLLNVIEKGSASGALAKPQM